MRTFEHFPEHDICLVCGTNEDKECTLIPIDGTEDGNNCQATPVHIDCISDGCFRYNPKANVFYKNAI